MKPGNPPKPRGYAFIEFEREKSVKIAYVEADGRKIDGQRRCVVDVERGRTVRGWLPRRLGGGLGGTRKTSGELYGNVSGRDPSIKASDRKPSRSPPPRAHSPRRPYRGQEEYGYDRNRKRSRSRSPKRHHHSNDYPHQPQHIFDREYSQSISYKDIDRPFSRRPLEQSSNNRGYF